MDKRGINNLQCKRCGTCCRKNPPTIHIQDIEYIDSGRISPVNLITFRKGEVAYDNVAGRLIYLEEEIVKIKAKDGTSECIYFDGENNLCTIYEFRPMECRILKCWDTDDILNFYCKDRINRFHIVPEQSAMGKIIKEHDRITNLKKFFRIYFSYKNSKDKHKKEELNKILSYDMKVRRYITEKTGANRELDFLFGRELLKIVENMIV